jgi:aspartate aminotransferase-like enzyme
VFTLTPGPAGAAPATLAALSQPILHHQDPAFLALYSAPPSRRRSAKILFAGAVYPEFQLQSGSARNRPYRHEASAA